jgi:hypothetical protein
MGADAPRGLNKLSTARDEKAEGLIPNKGAS